MVRREEISRLVDGELDHRTFDTACGELKQGEGMATWMVYHVIGETLREGSPGVAPGFSQKFNQLLAAEPVVVAPRARVHRPVHMAWAAAATVAAIVVTGWVALSVVDPGVGSMAIAKAREAAQVRAAQVRAPAVPQDYILAHQEYSPTSQLQGLGPTLRPISATMTLDARP
ncbi:MAG: sigma-E factor negative regulatory protein [Casimicrobiaceae bacterium]